MTNNELFKTQAEQSEHYDKDKKIRKRKSFNRKKQQKHKKEHRHTR